MAEARAIPSFGGYDDEFVDEMKDDWHCPICQLPLKEPVQTVVCGHRFCRQCLDSHFVRLVFLPCVSCSSRISIFLVSLVLITLARKRLQTEGNL